MLQGHGADGCRAGNADAGDEFCFAVGSNDGNEFNLKSGVIERAVRLDCLPTAPAVVEDQENAVELGCGVVDVCEDAVSETRPPQISLP